MSSITQQRNQHLAGPPATGWTDEHEKILRKIWGAGGSARQIAETIGSGFSRNAVISKVRRLGLHRNPLGPRKPTSESNPAPERKSAMSALPERRLPERRTRDRASYPKPTPIDRFEDPSDGVGVSFLELTNESCRWPKGTPGEPGFVFCGEATADMRDGKPYCPFHMRKRRVS